MVSGLSPRKIDDPQGKGRGRGYYYYRGAIKQPNGRRIKTWSKYDENRDARTPHIRTKVRDKKSKEKTQPHKADYKTTTVSRNATVPKVKAVSGKYGYVQSNRKTKRKADSNVRGYF